ncbi:hypothetical protein HMY34_15125 [Thiothrix subterranea]|uniref:hypothetical protein n=1 Tax=Thiothrix subterranea TaxID=2735563 RepID=UPI00192B4922|nr:hypothetical protein [Thiothrix subterranea]QQZ29985.1 hypothetical protein HMY34_15125 [Thiothrix subterranea]
MEEKAFVIISFNKKFKNVYDQAIKPAIEANHLISQKADGQDTAIREIYRDIAKKLVNSKIIIVDISKVKDNNEELIDLSNVYFELGLATAINKRCLFITRDPSHIPFDLKNRSVITYNEDDLEALKEKLTSEIEKGLKETPIDFFEGFDIFNQQKTNTEKSQQSKDSEKIKKTSNESCESGILDYLYNIFVCVGEDFKPYKEDKVSELQLFRLSSLGFLEIKRKDSSTGPINYVSLTEDGLSYIEINKSLINYSNAK